MVCWRCVTRRLLVQGVSYVLSLTPIDAPALRPQQQGKLTTKVISLFSMIPWAFVHDYSTVMLAKLSWVKGAKKFNRTCDVISPCDLEVLVGPWVLITFAFYKIAGEWTWLFDYHKLFPVNVWPFIQLPVTQFSALNVIYYESSRQQTPI